MKKISIIITIITFIFLSANNIYAARIKDLTAIKGVRTNQLIGYGLVVGLNGTGDGRSTKFTMQALANMMETMGVSVNKNLIQVKNVAAVMITAQMPPFSRIGSKIDIMVSSVGDAKSLEGGTLLLSPLKGVNGKVYALAQGSLSIGGYLIGNGGGQTGGHLLVARIANGATIEKEIPIVLQGKKKLTFAVKNPDFTTSSRIAEVINLVMGDNTAQVQDSGTVLVKIPDKFLNKVPFFIADIEKLNVAPDTIAKVVVNEKTGTVVMGSEVRIASIAISHGNIAIEVKQQNDTKKRIRDKDKKYKRTFVFPESTTIGDLVQALNAIGVTPKDLVSIFQTIKAAGALHASLVII